MVHEHHNFSLDDQKMEEVDHSSVSGQIPDNQTDALDLNPHIAPMKFSLKFTASRPPLFPTSKEDKPEDVEFVTEFDGTGRKLGQAATMIIPKLENSWRPEKRMKNIMLESDQKLISEDRFETDKLCAGPQPNVQYGLTLRVTKSNADKEGDIVHAAGANGSGFNSGEMEAGTSVSEREAQKLREDLLVLPEETSLDAYENMPVEEFGEALLRGMGWEKGKPIGRNAKTTVPIIEQKKRVGREGLGAIPAPKPEKVKRYIKPGETRDSKPTIGKFMSIIAGIHAGSRGRVVEADGNSFVLKLEKGGEQVRARLEELAEIGSLEEKAVERDGNNNVDKFREHATDNAMAQAENRGEGRAKRRADNSREGSRNERQPSASSVSSKELERSEISRHQRQSEDRAGSPHRKYDDERYGREGKSKSRRNDGDHSKSGKTHSSKDASRGERSKDRNYEKAEDFRHVGKVKLVYADRYERGNADREKVDRKRSELSLSSERRSGSHEEEDKMKHLGRRRDSEELAGRSSSIVTSHKPWLISQIRVRIVDKNAYGGKLYLKKGLVIDVVSPFICDIVMDESGELIQHVKQDHLETALPKRGGRVIVVGGKYCGLVGKLHERDSEKGVGIVQMEENYDVVSLNLDDLAEFVGSADEMDS